MRPKPIGPAAADAAGIEHIASDDTTAAIHGKAAELGKNRCRIVRQVGEYSDDVADQQVALIAAIFGAVIIVALWLWGAEVHGNHIRIGEQAVGVVRKILPYRTIVTVASVVGSITEVNNFPLGNTSHAVAEIHQQR